VTGLLALAVGPALVATRLQYTWSLLIFVVPVVGMARWLRTHTGAEWARLRNTLVRAVALLTPTGFCLNFCFADAFFVWPNPEAVLGITLPSLGLSGKSVAIPVEEFCFYSLGFTAVLLTYVWSSKAFFAGARSNLKPRTSNPILRAGGIVGAVCVGGFLVQRLLNPSAVLPGYLLYLALVPLLGTLVLYPRVAHRVNSGALTFTLLATLAISIAWEASLAIPGGWWGYRSESMLGVNIRPWNDLPIEAVAVWVLVVFASAVTWEWLLQGVRIDPSRGQTRPIAARQIHGITLQPLSPYPRPGLGMARALN
jgi:hypothetical protein